MYIDVISYLLLSISPDLPNTCPTYNGPHSKDCLKTVWIAVGCLPEGEKFPDKLISSELKSLSSMTYRLIKLYSKY